MIRNILFYLINRSIMIQTKVWTDPQIVNSMNKAILE
jgi:hypothetical protein